MDCYFARAENKGTIEGSWGVHVTPETDENLEPEANFGVRFLSLRHWCCPPRQRSAKVEQANYLEAQRQLYVWRYSQGIFAHHAVGFSYETIVGSVRCLRFFKAEILYDEAGLFLRFEGPWKTASRVPVDHKPYNKSLRLVHQASLQEVQDICKDVFHCFGEYHQLTNNCQHFVTRVLDRLASHTKEMSASNNKRLREEHLIFPVAPGEPSPSPSPSPPRRKRRKVICIM